MGVLSQQQHEDGDDVDYDDVDDDDDQNKSNDVVKVIVRGSHPQWFDKLKPQTQISAISII